MHTATTLDRPDPTLPHDTAGWTARLLRTEIPVLPETAAAIEALRANEDAADAHGIADLIAGDPLMTLKVLAHAATLRSGKLATGVETVTAALVMMGIGPFFRAFGPQPTVDERLAGRPEALDGLRAVLLRAHRAARFALAFAVHRTDPDAAVIHDAALLHDFAEMLLWCDAPGRALAIRDAQAADPALRSADAQRAALGTTLGEVQQALMRAWRLPELLARLNDDRHAEHPAVRSVSLAVRLARHSARGWDDAALPDDVTDLAALLNLAPGSARALAKSIDA